MPDTGLSEIDLWTLEAKWSIADAEAEAVRHVHTAAAESHTFVKSISAEVEAESALRQLVREYEPRIASATGGDKDALVRELATKRDEIQQRVVSAKAALKETEKKALVKVEPEARSRMYAKLVDPKGGTACDTSASRPPKVYYVIVGRGTAAVLNHATLRQTDAGDTRLKGASGARLPVLHIGLPDPWFYYHAHGMGQPPYLLTLPGLHFRPTPLDRTIRSGMHSNDFAYKTLQEWSLLKMKYAFEHLEGWVAVIQKQSLEGQAWAAGPEWNEIPAVKGKVDAEWQKPWSGLAPKPPFRLIVVLPDETVTTIYAEKIDICAGLGRASIQNAAPHRDATGLAKEGLTRLWEPPEKWSDETRHRKVVTGPEALCEMTAWYSHERHCVNGGGGIGLNQIERAEDVGNAADWLHYQTLHGSFNLARNDTVLKHPVHDRCMEPGESGLRDPNTGAVRVLAPTDAGYDTVPGKPRWRFSRFAKVDAQRAGVLTLQNGKVKVQIENGQQAAIVLDRWYTSVAAATSGLVGAAFPFSDAYRNGNSDLSAPDAAAGLYDRFWCTGGALANALGTAKCMMIGMTPTALMSATTPTFAVGLQAEGGAVRVLGSSAAMHPDWAAQQGAPTANYFNSLPLSAVPPGFIFAGVCIADANGFFTAYPNTNVNTMSTDQIRTFLTGKSVDPTLAADVAREVVAKRRPLNGFATTRSILAALDATFGARAGWKEAVAHLKTDYGPAARLRD